MFAGAAQGFSTRLSRLERGSSSLRDFLEDEQDRLLSGEKASASLRASPKQLTLLNGEFSLTDQRIDLLSVTFLDTGLPHSEAHGSDEIAAHLESDVHVVKS